MLDLGCGDGAFAASSLASGATVIGADVAAAALERARARVPQAEFRLAAEGEPLPVEDGWADVVWAGEVLEHVVDPVGLLFETRRVLRDGGVLLATTAGPRPAAGAQRTARPARRPPALLHARARCATSW